MMMIKKKVCLTIFLSVLTLTNSGCHGLLPSVQTTTKSPWQNFEEAKQSFEKIVPGKTSRQELKKLGFDPFEVPNINLITYLDLTQKFMPNPSIHLEDLDPGVQGCLREREACQGYEVSPKVVYSQRYGNVILDLFNFRRKKVTTGWHFIALIVLKRGLVVYKLWGGIPSLSEFEDKKNPLGPFQDMGDRLPPIKLN